MRAPADRARQDRSVDGHETEPDGTEATPPDPPTGPAGAGGAPTGGQGPVRLLLLGIVLLVAGIGLRWAQDVAAPYVNVGEADLARTVTFEAEAGTYRVVTSGPSRPAIHTTVCEIRRSDGQTSRFTGADGIDGGHERLSVTRVGRFETVAGTTEVTCGRLAPDRGDGLGRFQVVAADGPVSLAVTALFVAGGASLAVAIGWGLLALRRATT